MMAFFDACHIDMWDVVENKNYIPTNKERVEISRYLLKSKARNFLMCALTESKYEKVHSCKSSKEMWDTLALAYEEDEDEEENLYLMAGIASKDEDKDDEEVNFDNLEYLQIDYQELLSNSSILSLRYKELKRKISKLSKDFDSWKKKIVSLRKKIKREESMFQDPRPKKGGWVTFRGNKKGKIVDVGRIGKHPFPSIDNKLDHASLRLISKLTKHNLMRGLPSPVYKVDMLCDVCQKREQIKGSFKSINIVSTSRPLKLLNIDLFGPTRTTSLGGKHSGLVVVNDYSKWTWVMFLAHKDESFKFFSVFYKRVQNEIKLCKEQGILHNLLYLRTSQHNGIVERKKRSFQEMVRTMLKDFNSPKYFWAEVVNTTYYLHNRICIKPILKKTIYELWKGRQPNISYFHSFKCEFFILNTKDNLGKFDPKSNKGTFIGYSIVSKEYSL
ncbi:hypothetical protein CR513_54251, partial [Mucuna pruriens]